MHRPALEPRPPCDRYRPQDAAAFNPEFNPEMGYVLVRSEAVAEDLFNAPSVPSSQRLARAQALLRRRPQSAQRAAVAQAVRPEVNEWDWSYEKQAPLSWRQRLGALVNQGLLRWPLRPGAPVASASSLRR
jgi:hypothetical protein